MAESYKKLIDQNIMQKYDDDNNNKHNP